jgi:hypothetical protein
MLAAFPQSNQQACATSGWLTQVIEMLKLRLGSTWRDLVGLLTASVARLRPAALPGRGGT